MAKIIVTLKIMPKSPETDLEEIQKRVEELLKEHELDFKGSETKPIAFGLKELDIFFIAEEEKGSVDYIEEKAKELKGVESAVVIDVRREVEV